MSRWRTWRADPKFSPGQVRGAMIEMAIDTLVFLEC